MSLAGADIFRAFGIDPEDARAFTHHIDLVTDEARAEYADYLAMLERARFEWDPDTGVTLVWAAP